MTLHRKNDKLKSSQTKEVYMNPETALMNQIRVELSKECVIFRANVGKVRMIDGRFVEVKTETGRVRPEQKKFLERMQSYGFIAGVVRSVDDAKELIK